MTRELLKDVPVSKMRRDSTKKIVALSIEILNDALRPHLTKWQARHRYWYEKQLASEDQLAASPQDIQKEYPQFDDLCAEMKGVNEKLIAYRNKMDELIYS